ncbi:methyltransferase [Bdellovibrionota bacterium FG-2]
MSGLPVLLDALPRSTFPKRVLCFRCGYGILPILSRTRWPAAQVIAADRDLLATTFTRRNASKLGVAGAQLEIRESAHFPDVIRPESSSENSPENSHDRFDLVVGELSPSAGEKVLGAEIEAIANALEPGGQALFLTLEKVEREWVRPLVELRKYPLLPVISREGYVVLRLTKLEPNKSLKRKR